MAYIIDTLKKIPFKYLMKKIPLIGGLFHYSINDHWHGIKELFLTLAFALSPLTLAIFVDYIMKGNNFKLGYSLWNNLQNGELLLYATAILAPIFYTYLDDKGNRTQFPGKFSNLFIYVSIFLAAASIFSLQRAKIILNIENTFSVSIIIFILSLFLLYLVIIYNHSLIPPDAPREFIDQETDFSNSFSKHRG